MAIVGSSKAGKTQLVQTYHSNSFESILDTQTAGTDTATKEEVAATEVCPLGKELVELEIVENLVGDAAADVDIVAVCIAVDPQSHSWLEDLSSIINEARNWVAKGTPIVLWATKTDLRETTEGTITSA